MKLLWEDNNGNKYVLGNLYKENNHYYFKKNSYDLKVAINHGCFGIGNLDLSKDIVESESLFSFFKNRIPREDNPYIYEILNYLKLEKYDEFEILKRTHGRLISDKYYLED